MQGRVTVGDGDESLSVDEAAEVVGRVKGTMLAERQVVRRRRRRRRGTHFTFFPTTRISITHTAFISFFQVSPHKLGAL
jgi:hypothetical protein